MQTHSISLSGAGGNIQLRIAHFVVFRKLSVVSIDETTSIGVDTSILNLRKFGQACVALANQLEKDEDESERQREENKRKTGSSISSPPPPEAKDRSQIIHTLRRKIGKEGYEA